MRAADVNAGLRRLQAARLRLRDRLTAIVRELRELEFDAERLGALVEEDMRKLGDVNVTINVPKPEDGAAPATTDGTATHRTEAGSLNPDRQAIKQPAGAQPIPGSERSGRGVRKL